MGLWIADLGRTLIPSIAKTAQITPVPDSAALSLLLAWIVGLGLYLQGTRAMLRRPQSTWTAGGKQPIVYRVGLPILMLAVLYVAANIAPDSTGGRGASVYGMLHSSPVGLLPWGVCLMLTVFIGLLMPTASVLEFFARLRASKTRRPF